MSHVTGPLHYEVHGDRSRPVMLFVHPNPMDRSAWIYQVAHFSRQYCCISVDLPGYGLSPTALPGVTMDELAEACWDVVDSVASTHPVLIVGCSIGSVIAQHMYHERPSRVGVIVLSGAGWRPVKAYAPRRAAQYRTHGIDFRYEHILDGFSQHFRETALAHWFARLFTERNETADVETIIALFDALAVPDPEWLQRDLNAPVLIVTGSEDGAHHSSFALHDRLPRSEIAVMEGAGHACHIERPWEFDSIMEKFLAANR